MLRASAVSLGILWGAASAIGAEAQQPVTIAPQKVAVTATKAAAEAKAASNPQQSTSAAAKPSVAKKPAKKPAAPIMSEEAKGVVEWVLVSGDNRGLPFAVIDKNNAQVLVYEARGKLRGRAPVLIGSAVGDQSAPGVGDRELADIPMEDRTTPAGRFLVGFGPADGHTHVLWVDYNAAISMHAIPPTTASVKEERAQRIASKTPDDNRITHGCINVTAAFYQSVIAPMFKKGGVFYVLPDSETIREAIPAYGLDNVKAIAALEAADKIVLPGDGDDDSGDSDSGGE